MRTLRKGLADRLDEAPERAAQADATPGEHPPGWKDVLKSVALVAVARSAQRVLKRQADMPESGRLGGEVHAATRAPMLARPSTLREASKSKERVDEKTDEAAPTKPMDIAKRTFAEFGKDNGTLMGASVAFYLVLSIVPLVLVALAIFGHILGDDQSRNSVMRFVGEFFPAQKQMLRDLILRVHEDKGSIGLVGLGSLLLTATGGFATLETAINVTWGAPNRNFIMNKAFALLMMVVIGALLVFSLGVTGVVQLAEDIPGLHWLANSWILRGIGLLLSVAISGLMFTCIFKLFPNMKVQWKPALIAGFITAALWEVFKIGYTWYSTNMGGGGGQPGAEMSANAAMTTFVGLVMWIFYSSALVLLGSELTWVLSGCPKAPRPEEKKKH